MLPYVEYPKIKMMKSKLIINNIPLLDIAAKERFSSIETQLNSVRKMVIDGGMGPLSCSSDQIKVNYLYYKSANILIHFGVHIMTFHDVNIRIFAWLGQCGLNHAAHWIKALS